MSDKPKSPLMLSLAEMSKRVFHAKVYEPKKRLCGGHYGWVQHRFPVKDGISWRDVMIANSFAPNPLLELFRKNATSSHEPEV